MKQIVVFFFVMLAFAQVKAQQPKEGELFPINEETQKYAYWNVVELPGVTKDQLYNKAKTWGTLNKYTVVKDDKEKGEYVVKGTFKVKYISPMPGLYHEGNVSWLMTISCKDGKYRYVLTDFVHTSPKGDGGGLENKEPKCGKALLTIPGWNTIKKESKVKLEEIVETLKKSMSATENKIKSSGDDW